MDLIKPLIALLAIVNPLGIVPFFIHFTKDQTPAQRARTARVSAVTAAIVIAVTALAGLKIIQFFGISLASFQVGGGALLMMGALSMLDAQTPDSSPTDIEDTRRRADAGASVAVVPLAIPLLTGPATISTMIIYADRTRHWWEHAVLASYGIVVGIASYLAFRAAPRIERALGRTGINVMTRLMGLILTAMSVELLADGLVQLFPILAGKPG